MIRAEYQFHLPVPPTAAFDVLSNPERDPDWQASCVHARLLGGALGAGCRYQVTFQMLGRRMDFTGEVTDFDRPRYSRFVALDGPFRYVGSYQYDERGDGTTDIHWTFDVDPGEFFGVIPKPLLRKILVNQVKKDIGVLSKQLAAATPPT